MATNYGTMLDFAIAEKVGGKSVTDTFKRAFEKAKTDNTLLGELCQTLLTKCYEHNTTARRRRDADNAHMHMQLAETYEQLWEEADEYAVNNLKGKELEAYENIYEARQ